jgi:outer membrane protein assembly factor BamE (lipoprotein component of BamABCDE complex)
MNKRIFSLSMLIIPMLILLSGCGRRRRTSADFSKLSIGMTKAQVIEVLGEPDEVRGSTIEKAGNVTSVWSYDVYK